MFLYICDLFWSIVCRFLYGLRTLNAECSSAFLLSLFLLPLPLLPFSVPCLFMVLILVVFHSIKYPTNSSRKLHMSTHSLTSSCLFCQWVSRIFASGIVTWFPEDLMTIQVGCDCCGHLAVSQEHPAVACSNCRLSFNLFMPHNMTNRIMRTQ